MSRLAWLVVSALVLLPRAATAQEVVEYYGTDAIGSVRIVFDANGTVVGRMDYGPFGEQVTVSTVGHKSYAGLFRDGEAGLDYAEARSYQVRTGRFNKPDPLRAGLFATQAWNRYSYALGNPMSFSDRTGLLAEGPQNPWACGAEHSFQKCGGDDLFWSSGGGGFGFEFGNGFAGALDRGYVPGMPSDIWEGLESFNHGVDQALAASRVRGAVATSEVFSLDLSNDANQSPALAVAGGLALADSPVIGPGDVLALIYLAGIAIHYVVFNKDNPASDAKAPGKPAIGDGFVEGKDGGPWVRNPNGVGSGWRAKDGRVWVPTGPGPRAHGGPHWDVQIPGGGYENVYPGGRRRR